MDCPFFKLENPPHRNLDFWGRVSSISGDWMQEPLGKLVHVLPYYGPSFHTLHVHGPYFEVLNAPKFKLHACTQGASREIGIE